MKCDLQNQTSDSVIESVRNNPNMTGFLKIVSKKSVTEATSDNLEFVDESGELKITVLKNLTYEDSVKIGDNYDYYKFIISK